MPEDSAIPTDELARTICSLVSDAVLVTDPLGRIAYATGSVEEVLDRSHGEITDTPIWEVLPTVKDESGFLKILEKVRDTETQTMVGRHQRDGATTSPVELEARLVTVRERDWVVFLVRNVSTREEADNDRSSFNEDQFEQAPTAHFEVSADDGRILKVNRRASEMFGCSKQDLVGRLVFDLCAESEAGKGKARDLFERFQEGEEIEEEELELQRANGQHFWGHLFVRPILDSGGRIVGSYSTLLDITERKEAERRLLESEQWFRQIAEHIDSVFWIGSPDKEQLEYVSPAYAEIWGRAPEKLSAEPMSWLDHIHPDDRERVRRALPGQVDGTYDLEYRVVRPDGEIRWVWDRAFPIRNESGEVYRIIGVADDVTERKKIEARLEESEKQFRQLAEHIDSVFWITTPDKDVLEYVSPAYRKVWGRPPEELYDDAGLWLERVHPDDRERVREALHEQPEGTYEEEYRIVRPDGEIRWIWDRAFPVDKDEGTVFRIVGVAEDITARKTLEKELQQARKMEALGTLAGGAAHNYNNLLTVILADAGLLPEVATDEEMVRELAAEMGEAARQAQSLTDHLMMFGQQTSTDLELIDLNRTLKDEEPILRRLLRDDVTLEIDLTDDPLPVNCDESRLKQMVANLVTNAQEAMPDGGTITVSAEGHELHRADTPDRRGHAGSHVLVTVRDTGHGMEDAVQEKMFDPFFTTKDRAAGMGLGLSIVRGIVDEAGGRIDVDSAPGKGTTVRVYLPGVTDTGAGTADRSDPDEGACVSL